MELTRDFVIAAIFLSNNIKHYTRWHELDIKRIENNYKRKWTYNLAKHRVCVKLKSKNRREENESKISKLILNGSKSASKRVANSN